ncbi:DUF3455 domain-containing protein [Bradyrhizobium sp. WSM 1704]|uniref:DUF3455 domain-containing protein n=1 Tax=Bradyrhizobium semiaridum TaxID=2821404 RepID=UPI001CE355D0|nr:DUF3455 domain-containing protein [Bradyrhizobium semiaridum]MCA6124150.1 DUF3455 domain-containing protein [Bradyrhizobium semiaridum]
MIHSRAVTLASMLLTGSAAFAADPLPEAIAASSETAVLTVHALGAQVYECKPVTDGKLAWSFREPVATLIEGGRTVGRHYAGPNWEHVDGSAITGRTAGSAAGAAASDVPWLKLSVISRRGEGVLSAVTTVQRINTSGGQLEGPCDKAGALKAAPYSADYVFLRKNDGH